MNAPAGNRACDPCSAPSFDQQTVFHSMHWGAAVFPWLSVLTHTRWHLEMFGLFMARMVSARPIPCMGGAANREKSPARASVAAVAATSNATALRTMVERVIVVLLTKLSPRVRSRIDWSCRPAGSFNHHEKMFIRCGLLRTRCPAYGLGLFGPYWSSLPGSPRASRQWEHD